MNKRQFLKYLLAFPVPMALGLNARTSKAAKPTKLLIQNSPINGLQHHRGKDLIYLLQPGDHLHLAREPKNRFDHKAVALYWHGDKLGYLPRSENTVVAQMLDRGELLLCCIDDVNPGDFPWGAVTVSVEVG